MKAENSPTTASQFYLDNIAIHMGMAAEQVFVGHHGNGVALDLDGATRFAIILDRHLGMNRTLASLPPGVDERLIDSAGRVDGPLLKRIEPVLKEQLARAKTVVKSGPRKRECWSRRQSSRLEEFRLGAKRGVGSSS